MTLRPLHHLRFNAARVVRPLALIAVTGVASSCRRPPPSAGGPYGDIVAKAVPAVEKAVGLPFKSPPRIEVR
ncbi:MAG TPA: hypothetical protein VIG47_15705, partial [Gemmatimonadaceae bacterium]